MPDISPYQHLVGRRVRIPAGTPVQSMGSRGQTFSRHSQVVTVDHVLLGYTERRTGQDPIEVPHLVRWAGSGGYWRSAPAAAVELLEK